MNRRDFLARSGAMLLPFGPALGMGKWPQLYGSDLATQLESLGLTRRRWDQLSLNRTGVRLSASFMQERGLEHPSIGFRWNSGDAATSAWYPQGIADLPGGAAENFLLVSWYDDASARGVRVSFVDIRDLDNIRYRHALLVQANPAGVTQPVFAPVPIHAGGLATQQKLLFVADTSVGVRVFDMNVLFKAEANPNKNLCGIIGGKAYAYDYRYILPQMGAFSLSGPPRFSFASTDWTNSDAPKLLMGNYHSDSYDNPPPTLAWWNLSGAVVGSRTKKVTHDYNRVQGAAAFGDHLWLSCSGTNARLRVLRPSQSMTEVTHYSWPHGCEDLHHAKGSDKLWCLTEHPDERIVFAVKRTDYLPA